MTKSYLVVTKVSDLCLGDKFAGWSLELMYGDHQQTKPASRILDIKQKNDTYQLVLQDGDKVYPLHANQMVVTEVLA